MFCFVFVDLFFMFCFVFVVLFCFVDLFFVLFCFVDLFCFVSYSTKRGSIVFNKKKFSFVLFL